ncbi:hypothetical protein CRUP_033758 [Coryphaenoides rupestris]|nr:hypothetical protein CRUP_033758 [Coryphaenoides rupestris]
MNMSGGDMSRVLDILRLLYQHVQTLVEFADSVVFREGQKAVVVEESDTARFKTFARGLYICTFTELLAFVLNNLKRKRRRNVLAHGYGYLPVAQEERDADQFKFQSDVTQSAAYIHGSDLWKKVSARLGTDMTCHLLESCTVFVAVCGVPVYDRVSVMTSCGSFFHRTKSRARNAGNPPRGHRAAVCRDTSGSYSASKNGGRGAKEGNQRKRKRGKMVEGMTRPGKRTRIDVEGTTQETQTQSGVNTGDNAHPSSAEAPVKPAKGCRGNSKRKVITAPRNTLQVEGAPSWRSRLSPPLPPSQCFIRTLAMLYGGRGMRGFLLNRKKKKCSGPGVPSRLRGRDLVRVVFFEGVAYLNGVERRPRKLPQRFFHMVPLFEQLLRRHRSCPYDRVLQKACPSRLEDPGGEAQLSTLLPLTCAPQQVYLFVRECLAAVVPTELWGSEHNRVHFLRRVKSFLRSGKFERISLAELLWKMRVNDCDWLKISKTGHVPPSELAYRTRVIGQLLTWLLDSYVVGLVRACFYVTESMGQKNTLRFYRHEMWAKMQELAFRAHVSKGQLEELSPAQVASLPKTTVVSRLRFIPKADSMRPITRVVKADAKSRSNMRELLDVLGACVKATPHLLGYTVWGMNDIHKKLRPLAATQKDKPRRHYFVKVDVSGAYESLPHDKLVEVIGQALTPVQEDTFIIRRYGKIWSDAHEGLKKSFPRQVSDEAAGVRDYGLVVNRQKVVVNFQVSEDPGAGPGVRTMPSSCLFPWCGLLLDTHTLDVYKDYSR